MIRIDEDAFAAHVEIDMGKLRRHGVDTGRIEVEPEGTYRLTSADGTWIAFGPDAEGGWDLTVYDAPTDDESGVEVIAQDYAPDDAEVAATLNAFP